MAHAADLCYARAQCGGTGGQAAHTSGEKYGDAPTKPPASSKAVLHAVNGATCGWQRSATAAYGGVSRTQAELVTGAVTGAPQRGLRPHP